MNQTLTLILSALLTLSLTSCTFMRDNAGDLLDATKAGSLVMTADQLAVELAEYIAGDDIAIDGLLLPDGPVDYALRVADFMKGNLKMPVVDVALLYPEYLSAFKAKMIEGRIVVMDYADRTGKPIPANLEYMWLNGVDAMRLFDKAKDVHDETFQVSQIYSVIEPYVRLGLLLKGVAI